MSYFITLEGPEGGGKSTQVTWLAERLRAFGQNVLVTREPGGTAIGDQIRQVLHDLSNSGMQPRAEALLLAASRAQLVGEIIRPALDSGRSVLCDRYADSTLAYQGYGHGLDLETLRGLIEFATGGLTPDLTLLLDIDPEEGLRRRRAGGGEWNRLDAYELDFHRRVREGYFELMKASPARWVCIDASRPVAIVRDEIWEAVRSRLLAGRGISPAGDARRET